MRKIFAILLLSLSLAACAPHDGPVKDCGCSARISRELANDPAARGC